MNNTKPSLWIINTNQDQKAFILDKLETEYRDKVKALNNRANYIRSLEAMKADQLKELNIILNSIYTIKELTI